MAGDWIKVEKATLRKPEVNTITRLLGVSRHHCVGLLVDFWSWLDDVCVDGVVDACVDADVDAVMSTPGLAAALKVVGWVTFEPSTDGLSGRMLIPNHDRYFGESSKARSMKSERQARWRAGKTSTASTGPSTTPSTRKEKRREEKKELQPHAQQAAPGGVRADVWEAWKKARGKKLTADAVRLQTAFLAEQGGDPNAIIEQSIRNGWQGLFPLKSAGPSAKQDARAKVANEIWGSRHDQANERVIDGEAERVA